MSPLAGRPVPEAPSGLTEPSQADWSDAIRCGREAEVQQWLDASPPPAHRCAEWIGWAATWGQLGIAHRLLPHVTRAALNAASTNALMLAARYGHVDLVTLLLPWFDDPLQQNTEGLTALHLAAVTGQVGTVKALLPAIPATTLSGNGTLPLHEAAMAGSTEIIAWLVPQMPVESLNHRDQDGFTPLLRAVCMFQERAVEQLAPLTDLGLRYQGQTALEFAQTHPPRHEAIVATLEQATRAWEAEQLRRASAVDSPRHEPRSRPRL